MLILQCDYSSYKWLRAPILNPKPNLLLRRSVISILQTRQTKLPKVTPNVVTPTPMQPSCINLPKSENPIPQLTQMQDIKAKGSSNPQSAHKKTTSNYQRSELIRKLQQIDSITTCVLNEMSLFTNLFDE